ncbi:AAA family ATPase [Vibrio owensii]|uniref:AAA family ATPase n=1 Tax=Vibrio owensii TaxID=696485 RepID=UPI003CC656D6
MYNSRPTLDEVVLKFGDEIPLLKELEATQQDKVWHAEGNVHIHTNLCLQALYGLLDDEAKHLSPDDKKVLFWAVALHDIGKPLTTRVVLEDREYVKASRHEVVGASELIHVTPIDGMTLQQWIQVIKLIAYHQKPKHLVLDDAKAYKYISLLREVENVELLYFLEKADMIGRVSEDQQDQIEMIDLFWLECQSIFGRKTYTDYFEEVTETLRPLVPNEKLLVVAHRAVDWICSGDIFMAEEAISKPFMYEPTPTITLTVGCSGSGKSSYVKALGSDITVISYDQIREEINGNRLIQDNFDEVKRIGHERLKEALRAKKNIVWDATSTRNDFRDKVIATARAYGAYVKIVVLIKDAKSLHRDNKCRDYAVPDFVLNDQIKSYQLTSASEGHELVWWDAVKQEEVTSYR